MNIYELHVHLRSSDDCEGYFVVRTNAVGAAVMGSIVWSPSEPDQDTESVTFRRLVDGVVDSEFIAAGDTWRQLEDGGLDGELFEAVLTGADIEDSLVELGVVQKGHVF